MMKVNLLLLFHLGETSGKSKPYWLTPMGLVQALKMGSNLNKINKIANEVYDENRLFVTAILIDMAKKNVDPAIFEMIGKAQYNMFKQQPLNLTVLDILSNLTEDLTNTLIAIGNNERLAPMVV